MASVKNYSDKEQVGISLLEYDEVTKEKNFILTQMTI